MISATPMPNSVVVYVDPGAVFNLEGPVRAHDIRLSEAAKATGKAFIASCRELGQNPREEIVKLGYKLLFSEQDNSYAVIESGALYTPTTEAMVQFAEKRGWSKVYLDPSCAATRSVSAAGADSIDDGVRAASGIHERVALSHTSGDTVSPSVVTARQSLPATTQGSMMTSDSIAPSLPLVIGSSHPDDNTVIYHSTDNPKVLDTAAQRSLPFADAIMKQLASKVTGAEYCDLAHPSGPDIKYDNSAYRGDSGGTGMERLIEANLYLDHENQVGEAVSALDGIVPGIPKSLHLPRPLGQEFGAHSVNVPMDTGVSIRVNMIPKEMRGVIEANRGIASKVKDWSLSDVVAAKREIQSAIKLAYEAHRGRVYNGQPLKFSESANSQRFVDRSKILVLHEPLPGDLAHLGPGSAARCLGLGMEREKLLSEAKSKGYTAVVSLSEAGYTHWEPLGASYIAESPSMREFAKARGFVNVDSRGRQIGD